MSICTIDQISMRNVDGVICNEKPTKNFQPVPALQFPSTLHNVLQFLTSCFDGILSSFQLQQAAVFGEKTPLKPLHATCPAPSSRQTQLASTEPDIFFRSWWRPKQHLKESKYCKLKRKCKIQCKMQCD